MTSNRPSRTIRPAQKLNEDNIGELQLESHRNFVKAAKDPKNLKSSLSSPNADSEPSTQGSSLVTDSVPASDKCRTTSIEPASSNPDNDSNGDFINKSQATEHQLNKNTDSSSDSEPESNSESEAMKLQHKPTKKPKKKKKKPAQNENLDPNGMHADVHVQDIGDSDDDQTTSTLNRTRPTADTEEFFQPIPLADKVKGDKKKRVKCVPCATGLGGCSKKEHILVGDVTTLRRHMAAIHKGPYRKWAKLNNFESMLPEDSKARRAQILEENLRQTNVNDHFKPAPAAPKEEKPEPFSDELFKQAAIEWLIETNQPIQAFDNPAFQKMVNIAARATRGLKLPSRKQTRNEIKRLFKEQMKALKERLNSNIVSGEISLTCDAWQASNADAYFAVTGHWIEEAQPEEWVEQEALFGFTQMNTAHNGVRLGQALYKVCARLEIVHKIGHITCDNASNNDTMLDEFGRCFSMKTGIGFNTSERHIRCLAHIINLATQALIATRSKAKFYSPDNEDAHIPETQDERDELGLVRAICVKARSSSQRKALFKEIQEVKNEKVLQLLVDMKVRWGSTYAMLNRAETKRDCCDEFVYALRRKETSAEKRRKLGDLALSEEEWNRVRLFCNLLQYADIAQQAFSASTRPTLHNALPAIEKMYSAWQKASEKPRYDTFKPALEAAMAKLDEYYKRTAESDAHIIAMVLDPRMKFKHFTKNWDIQLQDDVKATVQKKFIERYESLNQPTNLERPSQSQSKRTASIGKQRRQNIDDTESEGEGDDGDVIDAERPWLAEWNRYEKTHEAVPEGMGIVRWWGRNAHRYPTWSSLARDYLAIMASSVSSERAFSAAGITISKRRNRLQGDIVEAIEVIKCLLHHDLIFREVLNMAHVEKELEDLVIDEELGLFADAVLQADEFTWDSLIDDDEDA